MNRSHNLRNELPGTIALHCHQNQQPATSRDTPKGLTPLQRKGKHQSYWNTIIIEKNKMNEYGTLVQTLETIFRPYQPHYHFLQQKQT